MRNRGRTVERTCIACRETGDPRQFIRYVVGPAGEVVVDYRQRLPGRGAYTCLTRACIAEAVRRKGFARAFRRETAPVDAATLTAAAADAIAQRIAGLIGIARKAGNLVSGIRALRASLDRREIACLVVAADAGDAAAKLLRTAELEGVDSIRFADRERLGQASGSESADCIGIRDEQIADTLELEVNRLHQIAGEN